MEAASQRFLAHEVIFNGKKYRMSVVEISSDRHSVLIYPFVCEEHSVRFINGCIEVVNTPEGYEVKQGG